MFMQCQNDLFSALLAIIAKIVGFRLCFILSTAAKIGTHAEAK